MNLAFSTLLLFFILLPGIFFRRFYYAEEFSKEYFRETFFGIFLSTFIPSLLFQGIWFLLAKGMGHEIDLHLLFNLISQSPTKLMFTNLENDIPKILLYNTSLFLCAASIGHVSKNIVRTQKWDRRFKHLRFQNSWHYILKGEFFDFARANITLEKDTVEDIEFVFVDALIDVNGETILYDGILVDYELSKAGGLETISLKNVQRRALKDDSTLTAEGLKHDNHEKYYPVQGHILLLKYSELKNINFSYYKLERNEDIYEPRLVQ